jgi:hypothetical protein
MDDPFSWRGLAPGSRKDAGFFSASVASAQAIVLCESAIDALSCHARYPACRGLSTSGARPDPAWLTALLHATLPVFCGFDADPTGDAMAHRMIQLHPAIARLRPPAKDWNDALPLPPRSTGCLRPLLRSALLRSLLGIRSLLGKEIPRPVTQVDHFS